MPAASRNEPAGSKVETLNSPEQSNHNKTNERDQTTRTRWVYSAVQNGERVYKLHPVSVQPAESSGLTPLRSAEAPPEGIRSVPAVVDLEVALAWRGTAASQVWLTGLELSF